MIVPSTIGDFDNIFGSDTIGDFNYMVVASTMGHH